MIAARLNLPPAADLRALIDAATALPALNAKHAFFDRLFADYERGLQGAQRSIVVALVGATGAGKSTLLNALAGRDLAKEGSDRPTSEGAVVYAPDDAVLPAFASEVTRYRVPAGAPWSGQVFIDTPDLNSVAREHREMARRLLDLADVALVVMHKGAVAESAPTEFLAGFARRRRLLFALNFADEMSAATREALKAQVAEVASARLGLSLADVPIFAVSALEARQGRDPSGEWPRLIAAIEELADGASVEKIRRSNAVGVLYELRDQVAGALQDLLVATSEVGGAFERGWASAVGLLREDFQARLAGASGHIANEVRRAASSRWWGPAAWWMRLSMLGAGGLGAAALIGRRNLPIGLAVAAASTAIDKVKEHTLAASADRRVVGAAESALHEAARTALAGARVAAQHEGLDPQAMGLPTVEQLLESLESLRASTWSWVATEAVAEATRRWWRWARWLLMPLINLPLLFLLGHVAYNVVRSYLFGPYLGLNYFLNAAALGAVLSIAGGLLASLSLAGAARRVRARGRQRFDAALLGLAASVSDATAQGHSPARLACERLVGLADAVGRRSDRS